MNHADIMHAFGLHIDPVAPLESLTPDAPVYRARTTHGECILKRTQAPLARAQAVATWTRSLATHGVAVVTPAAGVGDNPRTFGDASDQQEVWVVYPFVPGRRYAGTSADIRAAGDVLGRLHVAGMDEDFGLNVSETVVPIAADELAHDVDTIVHFVSQTFSDQAHVARVLIKERTQRYLSVALPRLLRVRLPLTNASWDYKAANLVYRPDGTPVLVDPDNGGRIPRAYDLAIAALLFHTDVTWPNRVFAAQEWSIFVHAYARHLRLSDVEVSVWDDLVLCAWIDEALWLLREHEAGWKDAAQARMLLSLLSTPLSTFSVVR